MAFIYDFNHEPSSSKSEFPSHYEQVVSLNFPDKISRVKQQALTSMVSLEGWCSTYKGAILIDLILMANPKTVVEIGVWGGKSLIPMAYALRENGDGKIYGIDPWASHESIKGMDGVNKEWWGSVNHQKILDGLIQKINHYDLNDHIELLRTTSEKAAPIYDIGLIHFDGNHSEEYSYYDVVKWVPFVKKGGIIVFDDIGWSTPDNAGTDKAVAWLNENCIKMAEIKGENVWGIWIKP